MAVLLIADDSEDIRLLYADEFEGDGYEVITASNGEEAVNMVRENNPDLVILDIGMPEKNGLEIIGDIARINGGTPVIVNTAYPLFKLDYRAHHAATWVEKSSDLSSLKSAVRQIVDPGDNIST